MYVGYLIFETDFQINLFPLEMFMFIINGLETSVETISGRQRVKSHVHQNWPLGSVLVPLLFSL